MNSVQISILPHQNLVIKVQTANKTNLNLPSNRSKTTNNYSKQIYTFSSDSLSVNEEQFANFFSYFKKDPKEKYSQTKAKHFLAKIITTFRFGNYSEEYFQGSRHVRLMQRKNNLIYFELIGSTKAWFDDVAGSIKCKANTNRQRLLFSLIELAYWQYVGKPLEKTIN